jgi:hypothetical protein
LPARLLVLVTVAALLASPAAFAGQVVPDEPALTEYAPGVPGVEGPLLPRTSDPAAAPGLTPIAERGLATLPPARAAALRSVATSESLGAPPKARARPAGADRSLEGASAPSLLEALRNAGGDAPFAAMILVLAVGCALGGAATAAVLRRGG